MSECGLIPLPFSSCLVDVLARIVWVAIDREVGSKAEGWTKDKGVPTLEIPGVMVWDLG